MCPSLRSAVSQAPGGGDRPCAVFQEGKMADRQRAGKAVFYRSARKFLEEFSHVQEGLYLGDFPRQSWYFASAATAICFMQFWAALQSRIQTFGWFCSGAAPSSRRISGRRISPFPWKGVQPKKAVPASGASGGAVRHCAKEEPIVRQKSACPGGFAGPILCFSEKQR